MTPLGKTAIRTEMLKKRESLSDLEVIQKSRLIGERVLAEIKPLTSEHSFKMGLYAKMRNEVDPSFLFETVKAMGASCFFPRMTGDLLAFFPVNHLKELHLSTFGVLEPKDSQEACSQPLHVLLVPGVAFSLQGQRIGYGKGYYDKTLAHWVATKQQPQLTIGLAYDFQILDDLPFSELDFPVDILVSENRILRRKLP